MMFCVSGCIKILILDAGGPFSFENLYRCSTTRICLIMFWKIKHWLKQNGPVILLKIIISELLAYFDVTVASLMLRKFFLRTLKKERV